jgi:hypothetical protein
MTTPIRRTLATVLAISLSFAGMAQAAPVVVAAPALIGTEQAAAAQPGRLLLEQTLARADVVAGLQARGVSIDAARERVAALTDAEAAQVAAQIDQAPAGGDALGIILTIFVILLITDLLGWTKVFPFTRTIR